MIRLKTELLKLLPWLLVPLLQLPAGTAFGLDGEIRLQPARQDASWVGQELELYLELWSDGFSFGDQLFVLPQVSGGYLLQADSSTVKLNEKRNGTAWQGLRYTLLFYPQRAGQLEVPAFEVGYTASAGFGTEPTRFQFQTPPLQVEAKLPPGADSTGLLVTTASFDLQATWTPPVPADGPLELKVGDALTLEVRRKAQDVPGMVFSPLPVFSIDGMAAYPASPEVNDQINRGSLTGSRTDSVTFILERDGDYTIPEMRFQWWDPEQEKLSEKVVPAAELAVAVNPSYLSSGTVAGESSAAVLNWKVVLPVIAAVLLLVYLLRHSVHKLADIIRGWQAQRARGEPWAFRQVRSACSGHSAATAYHAVTVWLARCGTGVSGKTLIGLAVEKGDNDLFREAILLQESVAAGSADGWDGRELFRLLSRTRKNVQKRSEAAHVLQPLNPSGAR